MEIVLPAGFRDSNIHVSVRQNGAKIQGDATPQALFMPVADTITLKPGFDIQRPIVQTRGILFGETPKVYIEFRRAGHPQIRYKHCNVDRNSFIYSNYSGKPSAMESATGQSYVEFAYPKLGANDVPTGCLVIDNGLARDAFLIPDSPSQSAR